MARCLNSLNNLFELQSIMLRRKELPELDSRPCFDASAAPHQLRYASDAEASKPTRKTNR